MFKVSIPKISDEELTSRYEQIEPVVTWDGKLHYFKEFDFESLRNISFLWNIEERLDCVVPAGELEVLEGHDFICLHSYGAPNFFKPSIAEVLAQIDECSLKSAVAFEIIESPCLIQDFNKDELSSIAFKNGYHVSTVRLYRSAKD